MKKNIFIYLGQAIAILIIIGYFFLKNEIIESRAYSVLINLSYSFTAAFIFYILQVIIPSAKQQRTAKKLLAPNIHKLCQELNMFIAFTENVISVNNDQIQINGMDNDGLIYYKLSNNSHDEVPILEFVDIKKYLYKFEDSIKADLSRIRGYNIFSSADDNLHDLINEIELSRWGVIKSVAELYGICESFQGLSETVEKIKAFYSRLSKYDPFKSSLQIKILDDKEKKKYSDNIKKYKPFHDNLQKEIQQNHNIINK